MGIKCKLLLINFIFSLIYSLSKISLLLTELDTTHDSGYLTSAAEVPGRYPMPVPGFTQMAHDSYGAL